VSSLSSLPATGARSPLRERLCPLAAGVALAIAALVTGRLAVFAAAPLGLALLALAIGAEGNADAPRRWVGAGLATALAGVILVPAGAGLAALLPIGLGLFLLQRGVCASLRQNPPPPGLSTPALCPAVALAVTADEITGLAWETARRTQPRPDFARMAADVRAAADRNREHGWIEHPERAYLLPPRLEKIELGRVRLRGSGQAERLRFASEFEPLDPEVRDVYLARRHNGKAVVHLWRHAGSPRPTLICLHGHRQGHPSVDARLWDARWLHRSLGFDVALFALPLHGPRASARSGGGFLDGHPLETNAALEQSIWDLRRLAGWLQDEGAPALGVAGFGLGGYVAALFASLAPNLASVALLAPIVSLETFAWRLLPPARRAEARAAGITDHWLSAAWARHDPRRLRPRVSHESRLMLAGLVDRIVPPLEALALWEHWGRPAHQWYPGSHFVWLDRQKARERICAHLRATLSAEASEARSEP
jgi:hypothetical protein